MTETVWVESSSSVGIDRIESTLGGSILGLSSRQEGTSDRMLDVHWRQKRQWNRAEAAQLLRGHRQAFTDSLAAHTNQIIKLSIQDVLGELSTQWGVAWVDVARMVGVSVPALRKWRVVGRVSGENQRRVSELLAFIRVLKEAGVQEPGSWISIPMVDGYTATPRHLYGASSASVLVDVASNSIRPEDALDELVPGWKEDYSTDFVVRPGPDGLPAIVHREQIHG